MTLLDNGGFIGRTADYSDDSFYTAEETVTYFSDDFETFTGWITVGSGVLSQSSTQAYAGTYSAIKTTNGDPNGAYKLLDATVNREYIVEAWIFSEDPRAGGAADRISIVDASGNGYGLFLAATVIRCERRDALSSTLIADSTWTRPSNAWYRVTLEAKSNNTFVVTTYNTSGTQLATVTSSVDTTHSGPFDRVMILGGANYYVDNLTVTNLETVNKNKKNTGLWNLDAIYKNFLPDIYTNSLVLWMDAVNEKSYGVSENFVPYSTDITPSSYPDWIPVNSVSSTATTGVDGQNDAFILSDNDATASGFASVYILDDNNAAVYETVQTMTAICHVKKNTGGPVALIVVYFQDTSSFTNGTVYSLYLNPDNGIIIGGSAINAEVVSEDDWWRVMFEVETEGAGYDRMVYTIYPAERTAGFDTDPTITGSNTFWNPQLQRGPKSNYSRPVKTGSTPIKREERWWDVSGQNNDGVVTGGAVYNSTYFEFDGLDDYIELGTITTSNPLQLSSPADGGLTIMFATYWDGTGDDFQRIIDKSDGGNALNGWCIFPNSISTPANQLIFRENPGPLVGDGTNMTSTSTLTAGVWEIWAVTHDQSSGNWSWYKNGVLDNSGTDTYVTPSAQTNARIGTWNHDVAREWNGRIGFMLVYEKALTQQEITQNYNALKGSYGL